MDRKQFLSLCVMAVVMIGLLLVSYPFMASWNPNPKSNKVTEFDISQIKPGDSRTFEWRGKPVMLYKPSNDSARYLVSLNDSANGSDYTLENMPDFFIYVLLSTHLGCELMDTGEGGHYAYNLVGFWDPCHRGFWDYAGRLLPEIHGGDGLDDLQKVLSYRKITDSVIRIEQ